VLIYKNDCERQVVAAIEFVCPFNNDGFVRRNAFVAKCAMLLQKGIAVSVIDLVTTQKLNLYSKLLTFVEQSDPRFGETPPSIYAATCRWTNRDDKIFFETASQGLAIGEPLPTLPLWLSQTTMVPLDLEPIYEQACYDLRIT
jgi:hypothetical protein